MVVVFIFVRSFNLPLEIAAIVAGIYRLIDMGATTINCMGDLVWTTIAAKKYAGFTGTTTATESNE